MVAFPRVGDEFGRYRITSVLGRGGMGVVFEATDTLLNRPVALKVLMPTLSDDDSFRARFAREASVLAKLDSLHVVQVYDSGEIDGCLYLATQLVRGGDLQDQIRRDGIPAYETALSLVIQVCRALVDAHAVDVIHRDVKPSNVLVRPTATGLHVYLCDFGIAQAQESHHTHTGSVIGSTAYMAPERHNAAKADERSDIYSVGCLLYYALTGNPPYVGLDVEVALAHVNAEIPELPTSIPHAAELDEVLARALAKDPNDRYASAADLAAALEQLLAAEIPAQGQEADATAEREDTADGATILRNVDEDGESDHTELRQVAAPADPTDPDDAATDSNDTARRRRLLAGAAVGVLVLIGGVIAALVLGTRDPTPTGDTSQRWAPGSLLTTSAQEQALLIRSGDTAPSARIALGPFPTGIAVAPAGTPNAGTIYVANNGANTLTVIAPTDKEPTTVPTGRFPTSVAVGPPGASNAGTVYVTNNGDNTLTVLAPDGAAPTTVKLGPKPRADVTPILRLAVAPAKTPQAGTVYVTSNLNNTLTIVAPDAAAPVTVKTGRSPTSIAIAPINTPDVGTVYVANSIANSLTILSPDSSEPVTVTTGRSPTGVAVAPADTLDAGTVYVTNNGENTLTVLNPGSDEPTTIPTGRFPTSIAIAPTGTPNAGTVYITNNGDNTLTVLNPGQTRPRTVEVGTDIGSLVVVPVI